MDFRYAFGANGILSKEPEILEPPRSVGNVSQLLTEHGLGSSSFQLNMRPRNKHFEEAQQQEGL